MHVSPFLPAQATYTLRYSAPEEGIRVSLDVAAPASASPYGRGHEPDRDTTGTPAVRLHGLASGSRSIGPGWPGCCGRIRS